MPVENGVRYFIKNVKGGTYIDLDASNNSRLIGYPKNGGENQQWELESVDDGWQFKSVSSGLYWALDGGHQNGVAVVVKDEPVTFHLSDDPQVEGSTRISIPDTNKDVDLSDNGNITPGTPIAIYGRWDGQNQLWFFEQA
ncbi:hypothetical protein D9619_008475 [Psilocybe cf. subviscida]|uniref:Ricin B lectin domain-containing protein n=1 Tax=Psilocybe cf. subviscida TaxID=2480587 RepID=A0A8H5F135_9AGAR|nr:hypothetical protein D9619_008475 [Psilocybe cf. subviscida]